MPDPTITRRDVLKTTTAVLGAAALASITPVAAAAPSTQPNPRTIGIQLGPAPIAGADIEGNLDAMKTRGGVNTLFPFIYTYAPVTAGMPADGFRGGNFATPHMQFYKDVPLAFEDMRAPDFGDVDVLERALPIVHKRGMKLFAWVIEDHSHAPSPKWNQMYEVDFHGRPALTHPAGPCFNNPMYRAFVVGLIEDYTRSYDIDGIMWGSERQGGFFNALGAYAHGSNADPGAATCFCPFCRAKAKTLGIDADRAQKGFVALEQFVRAGRGGNRPRDGYFVSFFRILLEYPELLAWERMWIGSREDLQAQMYKLVKSIKPQLPVGWHVWHTVSFSPFHRAETDYTRMAAFSDYLKPVLYNNCAGERIRACTDSVCGNVFGDVPKGEALDLLYRVLDYKETPYDRVMGTGLSPDYVQRETRRAVDDVAGAAKPVHVWPGIDIDVPVPAGASKCTADGVRDAVLAAFRGGADGLILSRNFREMDLEHLSGAGAALKQLG
jgi:hypothetical protein